MQLKGLNSKVEINADTYKNQALRPKQTSDLCRLLLIRLDGIKLGSALTGESI
jgi:hypothetical protein